jgi:hypothetical protein
VTDPSYDADVETRRYSRLYREESAMAFSMIDCILNGEKGVYASSELTTGQRAYEELRARGLPSFGQLADERRAALLTLNSEHASAFARRLRTMLPNAETVVTPAPFIAPGWTQAEYLTFWETLIRTRIKSVYFNDGWQYSNGCTFEFAVACESGIPTFDAEMRPITAHEALAVCDRAMTELRLYGFDITRLARHFDRIRANA